MLNRETRKLQRWIDLVAALLGARYGLTRAEIRARIPGYAGGRDASFRRTFERDKDELRALGVPLETVPHPVSEETRYRVQAAHFYLPYLAVMTERGLIRPRREDRSGYVGLGEWHLAAEDLALLADAVRCVAAAGVPLLASQARQALRKLTLDAPVEEVAPTEALHVVRPRARADEGVLTLLGDALARRKAVTFEYYGMARDHIMTRTVHPYGLALTNGVWYLHAWDRLREALRIFRVSRMQQVRVSTQAPGSPEYTIPADFELAERARPQPAWALGDGPSVAVTLQVHRVTQAVRTASRFGQAVPDDPNRICYLVRREEVFLRWVLAQAGDVVPIAPPAVVSAYQALCDATMAVHRAAVP